MGYEFTDLENRTIDKAATWAKALGIMQFVSAAGNLIGSNILNAGVALVTGIFFFMGGQALRRVVSSQGHDVPHMMEALEKLGTAFLIRIILMALAAAAILCLGLFALSQL